MKTPVDERNPASERAKESVTSQPRECYDNADWSDQCCRTCKDSSGRSDDDDRFVHDDDSRTAKPPRKFKGPVT
eukprot:646993-Pyramimonas_sp.AAC.1